MADNSVSQGARLLIDTSGGILYIIVQYAAFRLRLLANNKLVAYTPQIVGQAKGWRKGEVRALKLRHNSIKRVIDALNK